MKKRILIIILIILSLLLIFGLYSHYIDSARVRNGVEPKFTVRIISDNGEKVTYWGLGYKVILYPSVSPSEPYKNNRGVKYGSWFMNYVLDDNKEILEIVDLTQSENIACDEALEEFYEDENYKYYYSCMKSTSVIVKYKDGSQISVARALKNGDITIKDLDEYNIDYLKKEKSVTNTIVNGYKFLLSKNNNCVVPTKYYTFDDYNIYLICLNDIGVEKNNNITSLKLHFSNINESYHISIEDIINVLNKDSILWDGGTTIYKSDEIALIKCNTLDGNKDVYIGNSDLEYKEEYCK